MSLIKTKRGPVTPVQLNHPTHLPVYKKVRYYERHPTEGPPIALFSGGSGARMLAQQLVRFTHHTSHVLPMFDDGGSSRELRHRFSMPPPGDLRNRLMAISDMSMRGNPEVSRLFRTRLAQEEQPARLQEALNAFLDDDHPQMMKIEPRYRRIIITHLKRFAAQKPADFDLRNGSIGNFVIAGAYLSVGDLESVIFEFSQLAAALGQVFPVCNGVDFHLKAEFSGGESWVGQARITGNDHPPIKRLAIVERTASGWSEVQPQLNPLVARAIRKSSLVAYTMGSFYTSLISILLVAGIGEVIHETRRPKVMVANLRSDKETRGMRVSEMLEEIYRYLCASDPSPGQLRDYVQYVLVSDHGDSDEDGRVPVDIPRIRALGVEPIELPLESDDPGQHDSELVAAVLLSLC